MKASDKGHHGGRWWIDLDDNGVADDVDALATNGQKTAVAGMTFHTVFDLCQAQVCHAKCELDSIERCWRNPITGAQHAGAASDNFGTGIQVGDHFS